MCIGMPVRPESSPPSRAPGPTASAGSTARPGCARSGSRAVAAEQLVEDGDLIVERHGEALKVGAHRRPQLVRQARDEILIGLVDEPVLVAQRHRIGGAHADVAIGGRSPSRPRRAPRRRPRRAAVQVLHRGDAARDHLERGEQRVGVEIDVAQRRAGWRTRARADGPASRAEAASARHDGGR